MRAFNTVFFKELLIFLRSAGLVAIVLYAFIVDVYVTGEGIEIKPKNVSVGYVNFSDSILPEKILSHLHQPEFQEPRLFTSQKELSDAIFNKEILVGIVFQSDFEKNLLKDGKTQLDILLDSTAASQSYITLYYLQNIVMDMIPFKSNLELKLHKLFNQNADTHMYMSFTDFISMLTLIGVILSASVFVKEKEEGTWDIMLLMPVDSKIIILAKAFSQVFIVICGSILSMGFVVLTIFNTPFNGSFLDFFMLTLLYSLTLAGIGLFIAAVAKDIMQVAQLSMLIMMPLIFLSGTWTPIYSMHPLLQKLSLISPLRYYVEGSESVVFRGTATVDLLQYYIPLAIIGTALFLFGFKKIGRLF